MLGEPLRVEIPLQLDSEAQLEPGCAQLAPRSGDNDDIPWLSAAHVEILGTSTLARRIVVTSPRPINSPALMLGLRIVCGVQLQRTYTLLLDPPSAAEIAPPQTEAAPPTRPTAASPEKLTPPAATAPGTRRTVAGETPASIAAERIPHDRAAQRRYARTLVEQNHASLGDGADTNTVFPEGSLINMPALAAANAHAAQTNTARAALAATEKPSSKPAVRHDERIVNRLHIGEGEEPGLQLATSLDEHKELGEDQRSRLRTEMELIASLDDKIATQLELTDKLKRLEALQAQLRADADRLEGEIRQRQAQLAGAASQATSSSIASAAKAPAKISPQVVTEKERLAGVDWRWLAAALGAFVALLLGWRWVRQHRETPPIEEEAAAQHEAPAERAAEGSMDEFFEPLSEEDIWPERIAAPTTSKAMSVRSAAAIEGTLGPLSVASVGPSSVLQIDDEVDEHDSAVELAEIMMSFGRVQGAAQTLADFIRSNPKQAVKPWIKLLEVYRAANMRTEFDALCGQLNKTFNVKPVNWDDFETALRAPESLEGMPHIAQRLCDTWGKRECQAYLHELLRDNRQGTRQGFPLAIIDEILLLLAILESHLGAYRPDDHSAAEPPAPPAPAPETVPVGSAPLLEPMDLSTDDGTPPGTAGLGSAIDFELDGMDLSKTLHINLDELDLVDTRKMPYDTDDDSGSKT